MAANGQVNSSGRRSTRTRIRYSGIVEIGGPRQRVEQQNVVGSPMGSRLGPRRARPRANRSRMTAMSVNLRIDFGRSKDGRLLYAPAGR